eukprot:1158882-Pelagomonas_calceolata.AAC.9
MSICLLAGAPSVGAIMTDDQLPEVKGVTGVTRGLSYSPRLWLNGCCVDLRISYDVRACQERNKVCDWTPDLEKDRQPHFWADRPGAGTF